MPIQYASQSQSIILRFVTNGVSKESTCADNVNMKLWSAENCTSTYQIHVIEVVKDMCDNICEVFGQGCVFIF